ncbi:MAG: type II toxin-antitoxin system HicA family toxin [Calditrichaeota bacterium]|nr:type II toxin-antitoxin system HicA family toxin [Calditrichota bacterium]
MKPTNRRELIQRLVRLGFSGPHPGKRHSVMVGRGRKVHIPNPHKRDISGGLLADILKQAGVSESEWDSAR